MALLASERRFRNFIDLCGQLRFQSRWAHLHRIPKTSVLGHSLYVAILSYLFSLEIKACPRRCVNNYITGLFHDLPEVLTRDIISPVKRSVEGLSELIKGYEKERNGPGGVRAAAREVARRVRDVLRARVRELRHGGRVLTPVSAADLQEKYNEDVYNAKDGSWSSAPTTSPPSSRRTRGSATAAPARTCSTRGSRSGPRSSRPSTRAPLRGDLLRLRLSGPLHARFGWLMMVFADRLAGFIGAPWATSFCNLHELWLTELTV